MFEIRFGWWNTGLSPNKNKNRAKDEEREIASGVIKFLLEENNTDFLAVCEVSEEDIYEITKLIGETSEKITTRITRDKVGKGSFDTAIFYKNHLKIDNQELILRRKLNRTSRVAQLFTIETPGSECIYIYTSHWPSRLSLPQGDVERSLIGATLRESIEIKLEKDPNAPIILMGDYNDEPFDYSIENVILASRDRNHAASRSELFYNPFWRHLSSYEDDTSPEKITDKGTYFHKDGQITKWRTFDQIIFSSSIISGKSKWAIDEHSTKVADIPALIDIIQKSKHVFDHAPVVSKINRRT